MSEVSATIHTLQPPKELSPPEKLAKLDGDIQAAKVVLKALEAQREVFEERALQWMIDKGTSNMRVDQFGRTVYFAHDVFASKGSEVSAAEFLKALHAHDLHEFDTYSPQTFKAWVNEQLGVHKGRLPELGFRDDGQPVTPEEYIEETLPKWLVEISSIRTQPRVRSRKVAKK